ncbi:hypothetical protein IC615_12000 [Serratia ureilytica]
MKDVSQHLNAEVSTMSRALLFLEKIGLSLAMLCPKISAPKG